MTLNEVRDLVNRLHKAKKLEGEAHKIWDNTESNLMYGKLSEEKKDELHEKTYEATNKHSEAMDLLRECIQIVRSAHRRDLEPRKN